MESPNLRIDAQSQPSPHILPLGPRVCLEIVRGRVRQRLRKVRGKVFLIGSASDCDLVLGDPAFPEAYAYLFIPSHGVTVRWLGAGPPMYVSGEKAEYAVLRNGDEIAFGPFALLVRIDGPPLRLPPQKRSYETPPPGFADLDDPPPREEVGMLVAEVRRTVIPPPALPPWLLPFPKSPSVVPRRASA
jgi:hypothetical protein